MRPDPRAGRLALSAPRGPAGRMAALALLALTAAPAWAQDVSIASITSSPTAAGGQTWSLPLQTLLLLTALTFIPVVLLLMTSFTRIIIVLSLLRQALGTTSAPPNQVLIGLALVLTMFVMAPIGERIYADAYLPFSEKKIDQGQALDRAVAPLRSFMVKQTREPDLALFVRLSRIEPPKSAEEVPLKVLVPAFVTSELKTAFQIAFIVFIPFLVIDLVVSSVLMSMGMMMLSPVLVSLPFKLMLFVLVDGWTLLIGSLVRSFSP
jgi:flagellar biosynthetic protein FliP